MPTFHKHQSHGITKPNVTFGKLRCILGNGGEACCGSILPQRHQVSKAAGIKSRSRKKLAK